MSIAIEKTKSASERFLLVRLNPARFIQPVLNGSVYEMSFPFIPNRIERNGVALTKDSTTPVVNDHWYYNEATQLLQVKLASAPNDTTNVLIAYYFLFYTGTLFRAIGENPELPTSNIRNWEPRLLSYPTFGQSFENILAGVFTISETNVQIINPDSVFQQYLTGDDSFYNKQVDIWICISAVENIQKVFTGSIQQISITTETVNLRCVDSFNTLNQPALMGDTPDECFFRRNLSSFPDLDPQFHETILPYIVGSSSRYKTASFSTTLPTAPDLFRIIEGTPAPCTSYDTTISTTTNRTFGTCRLKGVPATQVFGTIVRQIATLTGFSFAQIDDLANVVVGDTFSWTEALTTYHGIVNYVGAFTYSGLAYNIIFSDPDTPFNVVSTLHPSKSFGVLIQFPEGTVIYPRYGRDYTLNTITTSGGNNYVEIEFSAGFESLFAEFAGQPLDPNVHRVFFRASNSVVQTHDEILSEIIEKVGLVAEPVSFAQAYTDLPVNCRFHIPNYDELDYKSYLENVQDVLKSTLGYLKINNDFEVEYHILQTPSSTDDRDTSLTIQGGTSCEIEYADITTTIIAFNPHNDSQQAIDDTNSPSETRQSTKSELLHGLVNVDRFRHVLEEITSNIDRHIAIKSSRRASYSFQTASQDIDTELGDDLELLNPIILGGSASADLKIMSIEKSPEKISMRATDLKGL